MKKTRWIDWRLYRQLKLSHPGLLPDFGEIILSRRTELGLTRSELAERAGCHESTVYRLETAGYLEPEAVALMEAEASALRRAS